MYLYVFSLLLVTVVCLLALLIAAGMCCQSLVFLFTTTQNVRTVPILRGGRESGRGTD